MKSKNSRITVREAAAVLSQALGRPFPVQTVYTWIRTGKLPVVKVGGSRFVLVSDLENFLSGNPE